MKNFDEIRRSVEAQQCGAEDHFKSFRATPLEPFMMKLNYLLFNRHDGQETIQPAHSRHVYWFWEPEGGGGKTRHAKYLLFQHQAFYTTCGKAADVYSTRK
jgi:hypothetical protein